MINVAIVEDDLFFQEGLAKLLVSVPEIDLTGTFSNGEDFLSFVQKQPPQLLFLDIGLPGVSGIEVAEHVRREFPYMEIIFITADENHSRDAIRLYALDYISKPLDASRLFETLTRIIKKPPLPEKKIELKCGDTIEILNQEDIYLILYNHANQALNQVLILDPISGKQKSFTVSNLESGWWFDDSKRFVTFSTGAVIGLIPKITVIDAGNDEVHEFPTTGDVGIDSPPYGDQVLYLHTDHWVGELEKGKYPPERLVVLNVATNTSEIVTPDFLNIRSYAFSPSGNEIMFIGNLTPGEDQSIYMARKKKS